MVEICFILWELGGDSDIMPIIGGISWGFWHYAYYWGLGGDSDMPLIGGLGGDSDIMPLIVGIMKRFWHYKC